MIDLTRLEDILRRESSVIADEDVAVLMVTIYEEVGEVPPARLVAEVEHARAERGDD